MEQMQMNMPDIYDAALYLRLSKDDMEEGGAKSESNSIANQRELLRSFVKSQPDIQIFDIYVDDGYSGGNFDRPEFKRMTTDIEAGKVNCVIVKDLSRFGREYIEAGRWIEKTYPALNVRFISVTDQFDSKTADFSEKSFVVPIKNFVNESYCRDISGKVRSHQKIKREKGEFIGAFAPYGYCKDPENKNCLVIDSYAADIVRKIFSWKIDGFSLGAIAEKLNVRHVQSPKEYKKANGENYNSGFHSADTPKWSAVQIKRILTNEVYIGNMVQGKQERISYKVKQRLDKPESEWVKVENTHPAIIRQNDFDVVQKLLQYDGRASKTSDSANFFSGFVFCGDCHTPMIRRVNQYKGKKKAFYIKIGNYFGILGGWKNHYQEAEIYTSEWRLKIGEHFYIPISFGVKEIRQYESKEKVYTQEEMRILLSEEFQLFCKELEEKKIEILQKDVKIYLQENSAKAKGTLRIQEKIGQHNETEMIDF